MGVGRELEGRNGTNTVLMYIIQRNWICEALFGHDKCYQCVRGKLEEQKNNEGTVNLLRSLPQITKHSITLVKTIIHDIPLTYSKRKPYILTAKAR